MEIAENSELNVLEENLEYVIHVTGYVVNEGIVRVKPGSRIADVIESAGGITLEADLSKINLAYMVSDGQKINIPCKEIGFTEEEAENEKYVYMDAGENVIKDSVTEKIGVGGKININTATQSELETLTGIGPATASKIIEYRKINGKFKNIEDIMNVSGIGQAKFNSIKDKITK